MLKVDMDSYLLWSPLIDDTENLENLDDLHVALVKKYKEVANEFFELNAIFEQLWRYQHNKKLWESPDISCYIRKEQ